MTENQGVSTWPAEYQPQIKRNAFAGFSRHWTEQYQQPAMKQGEMVWVHKRHCPDDARSVFPTRATKPMLGQYPAPQPVPKYWVQTQHAQLGEFSRQAEEDRHFRSCQATRCEEWSSVREMLPSRGFPVRHLQERWGTSGTRPPAYTSRRLTQFSHYNSANTMYADDVHVNNKHLRLPFPAIVQR